MIVITLPWPSSKLNPNQSKGRHWASTSTLRKKSRQDAFIATPAGAKAMMATDGDIGMRITFMQPDNRARDRDNLLAASKPAIDGIADALGVNDARFNPVVIRRGYSIKNGYVMVEIEVRA